MRRILTVILLIAVVGAAFLLFFEPGRHSTTTNDPWHAVPANSAMILRIPDAMQGWDRFTHTSQLWEALELIPSMAAANRLVAGVVERQRENKMLSQALDELPLLVSIMREGDGAGALIIACPRTADHAKAYALALQLDDTAQRGLALGEVVELRPDTALPPLYIRCYDATWLAATSPQMLEEAVLQIQSPDHVLQDSLLARMRDTWGASTDANALIHLRRWARIIESWVLPEMLDHVEVPDGWVAMDLRSRPDALLMSGLLSTHQDPPSLQALRTQGAGPIGVTRVLPADVFALHLHHISDPAQYLEGLHAEAPAPELAEAHFSWVMGSMGRAWADAGEGIQRWAFLQAEDPDRARRSLEALCADGTPCEQQEYRGVLIQRTAVADALPRLLGPEFKEFQHPWWISLGDILLFSTTPGSLRASIDAWNDGNSLAEDERTSAWFQRISDAQGMLWWCDLARARHMIGDRLRPSRQAPWNEHEDLLQRIGGVSIQVGPGQRGHFHVVAGIQHAPLEQQAHGMLWSTELVAQVEHRPIIVRNHNNNTNEVLVQDVEHNLHLIGSTGKVLWTRKLEGPIMGSVHQVDRYKNGKLQLLFNSADKIHLIDRNGRDVTGFPVVLRSKAVTPLAVMDYENDKEYRVFLGTDDHRILNFALDGQQVNGWEKPRLDADAACSLHHLRIKNKDYLVFADRNGRLHILDRRGAVRERTALTIGNDPRVVAIVPGSDIMSSYVIWSDGEGIVQQGTFGGSVHTLGAAGTQGHQCAIDLNSDGVFELARIHGDTLEVRHEGRPAFQRTFNTVLATELAVHPVNKNGRVISIMRPEMGSVVLLDDSGREIPGSAVAGSVPPAVADLNLDGALELITATPDGRVMAYTLPIHNGH